MQQPQTPTQSPLPEYLCRCVLLTGRWLPDEAELVLELQCGFQTFDGMEPVAARARLRLDGVTSIEQWHRKSVRGVGDGTSRVPAPSPASPPIEWPYPSECNVFDVVLKPVGWMLERAISTLRLYQCDGSTPESKHRLVIGLFHPEFGDHDVWLAIDHQGHQILVSDTELDLAAWMATYQSWIRRAASANEQDDSGPEDIPWA